MLFKKKVLAASGKHTILKINYTFVHGTEQEN